MVPVLLPVKPFVRRMSHAAQMSFAQQCSELPARQISKDISVKTNSPDAVKQINCSAAGHALLSRAEGTA